MKELVIISLFDGLSGGRIALSRTDIKVLRYYSSEIDKYAISIADKNWPQDTKYRLGSVIDINTTELLNEIYTDFGTDVEIMLIGGSPCQGFSSAGKHKGSVTIEGIEVTSLEQYMGLKKDGFEFDGQSYLFWEFVRIRESIKPSYFFLENVRVTKKWLPMFNKAMGVEPININSSLVSAQNRVRYYWTNIKGVCTPLDKCIVLSDILEDLKIDNNILIHKSIKPSVAINIQRDHNKILSSVKDFFTMDCTSGFQDNKVGLKKSPCLRAGNNSTYILDTRVYRRLTVMECERLQTVPDMYTEGVSNTQRNRMLGNGWTIDVVSHIFRFMYEEPKKIKLDNFFN